MKRHLSIRAIQLAATAVVLSGYGCAQLEGDAGPTVVVPGPTIEATGPHSVVIGGQVMITAATRDGEDASYTFSSEDPSLATVDGAGVVTGVRAGETAITVMGDDSMATASYPIVVVPPTDASRIPYYEAWTMSAHADATAVAFNNWNQDGQVPTNCARCHSSEGFIDYIGGDGTAAGVVDKPAPTRLGDPLRHLPQRGRRRAVVGDVPVRRHRRWPRG